MRKGWPSLVASLMAAASLVALTQPSALEAQPEKGGQAPPFELQSLDGDQVSLADQRGKFVVLHFGTGW